MPGHRDHHTGITWLVLIASRPYPIPHDYFNFFNFFDESYHPQPALPDAIGKASSLPIVQQGQQLV